MAGRGMGAATKGGGCVSSGARNKMTSKPSTKVAVMMKDGGMARAKGIATPAERKFVQDVISGKKKANLPSKTKKAIKKIREAGEDRPGSRKMAKPVKKMGGGMMKKYKKGGYAGCK
jgi:hypothetical protein